MLRSFCLAAAVLVSAASASAQSLPPSAQAYLGDWTTFSDETGEAQSVVRITEADGVVEGRVVEVLPTREHPQPSFVCDDCEGRYEGADLREVRLIEGMEWDGERLSGGRILDPLSGRRYRLLLTLDGPDRLNVRGYLGIKALGRTQVWRRAR